LGHRQQDFGRKAAANDAGMLSQELQHHALRQLQLDPLSNAVILDNNSMSLVSSTAWQHDCLQCQQAALVGRVILDLVALCRLMEVFREGRVQKSMIKSQFQQRQLPEHGSDCNLLQQQLGKTWTGFISLVAVAVLAMSNKMCRSQSARRKRIYKEKDGVNRFFMPLWHMNFDSGDTFRVTTKSWVGSTSSEISVQENHSQSQDEQQSRNDSWGTHRFHKETAAAAVIKPGCDGYVQPQKQVANKWVTQPIFPSSRKATSSSIRRVTWACDGTSIRQERAAQATSLDASVTGESRTAEAIRSVEQGLTTVG